jgi:hypothetical protein
MGTSDASEKETGNQPGAASQGDLADELRELGNNIKDILTTLWESQERKKVQKDLETGLNNFGSSLNQAASDFQKSPAGQRVKEDIDILSERIRSGEMEAKLRSEMLKALQVANQELQKAAGKMASTEAKSEKPETSEKE